jgi:hypothetical protein
VSGSAWGAVRRSQGLLLVALLALAAGACATLRKQSTGAPAPVTVWVYNQNMSAVHVYVAHGARAQSLGQLASQDSAYYVVPQSLIIGDASIQLVANLIAGGVGRYVSQPLFVQAGDQIRFRILSPVSQSYVMIR